MDNQNMNNNHSGQQQYVPPQYAEPMQYTEQQQDAWQQPQPPDNPQQGYHPPNYPPPGPPPPGYMHHPPGRGYRDGVKTALTTVSLIRGVLVIILVFFLIIAVGAIIASQETHNVPIEDSFSVIRIEGSITGERGFGDAGYNHYATVHYIRDLADNELNKGILLYMNTPGGTVYHSDELYLELLDYKKKTGRPVYAYMSEMCASGGYYISMAADYIYANRISVTGSIGVYSSMTDMSELFDEIGIRTVLIDTGEHKGAGFPGTKITPNHEAVMQSMIDEYYDLFVGLIADGRNMSVDTVRSLADGRIYTANQALALGLIDEISSWEKALSDFEDLTGVTAHYPFLYTEVSLFGPLFMRLSNIFPKNEVDIVMSVMNDLPPGVPLAIAPELIR